MASIRYFASRPLLLFRISETFLTIPSDSWPTLPIGKDFSTASFLSLHSDVRPFLLFVGCEESDPDHDYSERADEGRDNQSPGGDAMGEEG